jgi:hypothetical protein
VVTAGLVIQCCIKRVLGVLSRRTESSMSFNLGTFVFIGFFAGLLWLLRNLINWVLAVLNATH